MRSLLTFTTIASLLLPMQSVHAQENMDACGAVMCLAGEMMGGSGGSECDRYKAQYFAIQFWKNGRFKADWTADARHGFLSECKSAEPTLVSQVNSVFGKVR